MEAGSTYPERAIGSGGLQRGAQVPSLSALNGDRSMTEMESMSSTLAEFARRLTATNDRMQTRVDGFMQSAQALKEPSPAPIPEPQPGTIGALKFWSRRINDEIERATLIEQNLSGIL